MTAEVAILNRSAVALAADSAVTLQLATGSKIYQTRKLFTLSKYEPVGIMIYGNADFMEVPWETIIKAYRSELGKNRFRGLEQYAGSFLSFIRGQRRFFPQSSQNEHCYKFVRHWLRILKGRLKRRIREILETQRLGDKQVRTLFRQIVRTDIAHIVRNKKLPQFDRVGPSKVLAKYRQFVRAAIRDELQKLKNVIPMLEFEKACAEAILRDLYWDAESGIVIAGFGTDDFYPALRSYKLDCIIDNRLRFIENLEKRTDIRNSGDTAAIVAFAQADMVSLFMDGIDSEFGDFVQSTIWQILVEGYPAIVDDILPQSVSEQVKRGIIRKLKIGGQNAAELIRKSLWEYSRQIHSQPIVDIVNRLPKEELADMAETLINLTSFKRHVTHHAETVGGPIDVAIISRGDGLVWIKRKHYFRPELNPHFTANYFRETASGRR